MICEEVDRKFGHEIDRLVEKTRDTGREHAISVCDDGDVRRDSGNGDRVEIDQCEHEWVNVHTHPPGNPPLASRVDLGTFVRDSGDDVDRMCIVGSDDRTIRCLTVDRSDMTDTEYQGFLVHLDREVKTEGLPLDLDDEYPIIRSCVGR